ncbi:hypothetical protein [Pukyongiella litopenaei]|uniref:Uncharacterized protein n=1 Tax=Pukyongiella litopenaei TaxID=2605946 RepID=A0A5C2H3V1_9RHOB|nr:hypothetical protein [Pukyongiella litopenaei]QEP30315.1 hypothetical protein C6Y53_18975 [Pukyongiella litopenaei]
MSRRRSDNSWRTALRDARSTSSDQQLRELVKYLARRAADEDHESWLQRQRKKKLKETKNPPKPH